MVGNRQPTEKRTSQPTISPAPPGMMRPDTSEVWPMPPNDLQPTPAPGSHPVPLIPPAPAVRQRLRDVCREARLLRRLLRVAESAELVSVTPTAKGVRRAE